MELKVISFNILCRDDKDGYTIKERAPRLHKVISDYDPDLIGFQEYRPKWEKLIKKYFGDEYDIFNKYRSETIDTESAPILWKKSKFDCIKTGYFWLSDTPETESRGWDEIYNCFRMCEYVILQHKESGKRFTFMNTHFGFGNDGQLKSVKLIKEYSGKISSYPTFITGDFNMRPDSPPYALMTEFFTDANAVTDNDLRATFHGYTPEKYPDEHIDYCFTDKSIRPVSQKIIDELVDGMFLSDHYGLFIRLEL